MARQRQAEIDHVRARAEVLAEADEWIANEGSQKSRARALEQLARHHGVDGSPDLAGVLVAAHALDTPHLRTAIAKAAAKLRLTKTAHPGQIVPFNGREQRHLAGAPKRGTLVHVARPGYSAVLPNGEVVQVVKAVVEEATPEEIARARQTAAGMVVSHEFCRAPLHPGPCKGWKAAKVAVGDVAKGEVKPRKGTFIGNVPSTHGNARPQPEVPKRARKPKAMPPHRVDEKALLAKHGGEKDSRQLSTSDNASSVHLITMGDGVQAVHKKSKSDPETGKGEFDAEQLGAKVAEAIGLKPPRVLRTKDDEAYFDYIDTGKVAAEVEAVSGNDGAWGNNMTTGPYGDTPDGRRIGLLDTLIENPDRHVGNWFVQDDGSLTPIDHGLGWAASEDPNLFPAERPVTIGAFADHYLSGTGFEGEWRDNDLSPEYAKALTAKLAALKPMFDDLGRTDLHERMMTRMGIIAQHAKGTMSL